MNNQEKLYKAIGGASPDLIQRSERRYNQRWRRYGLAVAACLSLVLLSWVGWGIVQTDSLPEPVDIVPPHQEWIGPSPNGGQLTLPEQGGEIGTLRMLSYLPQDSDRTVDFLIYVNENQFAICEENGLYSIRSKAPLPDDSPECGLDILRLPGTPPAEAEAAAKEALHGRYTEMTTEELYVVLPGSRYLRASAGTDWDSEQAELWFVDDGQEGTFVLTARYFLEAEEGLGMRFRDMASSFRVVSLYETVPEWMRSLYEAAERLFPALLSNDLSGVSDLLAADAAADAYGEDVWANLTVASVDYAPDNDQDPASATVSVKHRLNQEEGESYSYLTMEMTREDGQWRLAWSGIEK